MHASAIASRLVESLVTAPAAVPMLVANCGMGRTAVLLHVRDLLGAPNCQYLDVERVATTPERFLHSLVADSPFKDVSRAAPAVVKGPRDAFDASLAFLSSACTSDGRPATFLLDEVLDLRTFENFPGLRTVVADLMSALDSSPNRFVMASRFTARAARLTCGPHRHLDLQGLPCFSVADVAGLLEETPHRLEPTHTNDDLARTVHALCDGRPGYVRAVLDAMSSMSEHGGADPIGALVALLGPGGAINSRCRFSYELRLHRARGYGALKAILDVLAQDEPLTLTVISQRLARTPGSTKDYLGWLEDVDLLVAERKRYRIADPILRLWIRVQSRSTPASDDVIVGEVQRYAVLRLAAAARAEAAPPATTDTTEPAAAAADAAGRPRSSGIVEFD